MKRILSLAAATLAVAFVVGQTPAKAQPSSAGSAEQIITQMEQDWGVAMVKKDQSAIDRIEASEWMFSDEDGNLQTKAQVDTDFKSGVYNCESFKVDEVKVSVFDATAVVFGLETEKSTYKGMDSSGQYRFTDVFVKRNGVWQAVATHVSKVVKH